MFLGDAAWQEPGVGDVDVVGGEVDERDLEHGGADEADVAWGDEAEGLDGFFDGAAALGGGAAGLLALGGGDEAFIDERTNEIIAAVQHAMPPAPAGAVSDSTALSVAVEGSMNEVP